MNQACYICFFFNDTATTEIYTLSLHDALPILAIDKSGGGTDLVTATFTVAKGSPPPPPPPAFSLQGSSSASRSSQIGRGSCRGRGEISVGAGLLKKKKKKRRRGTDIIDKGSKT